VTLLAYLIYRLKAIHVMIGLRTAVSWTEQDRANLTIFFKSQTGQRFVHSMHNRAMEVTQRSVFTGSSRDSARGWQEAFLFICQSSACDPLQVVANDGRVSLTETKNETSEPEENEESLSIGGTEGLGFPIGYPTS